jgi:ergothioneine biosynthesis protein EgtB
MTLAPSAASAIGERFAAVRNLTELLAEPLSAEDQTVQSMPDVSPTKWHRAHVSWFFEEFVLARFADRYQRYRAEYGYLFNSYYETVGARHPRPERGLVTRPGAADIASYRGQVDDAVCGLLTGAEADACHAMVELGVHHEQQHQELLLMDVKHVLSCNPFHPRYRDVDRLRSSGASPQSWTAWEGGVFEVGHDGSGFAFDNELPRHEVLLRPFALADRPVTCGEWLEFMGDGGYRRPELWMSDGWATAQAQGWGAPLYWWQHDGRWSIFTLGGDQPVDPAEPVCHVSWYEADAFARWAGARLPWEAEWEAAAASAPVNGRFLELSALHPRPASDGTGVRQLFGDVWEWTGSAYRPYPGYQPPPGAVGEYNGKFMVNQFVLRGGSCVTPQGHARASYRNFFPPAARWPFAGVRLASDV